MTIKTIVIACLTMPALVACTSTPRGYGPMEPGSSFGYSEQIIEQNRYRISYSASNEAMAREYALRRAAEVTEQNGGHWFRVVNSFSPLVRPAKHFTLPSPRCSVKVGNCEEWRAISPTFSEEFDSSESPGLSAHRREPSF